MFEGVSWGKGDVVAVGGGGGGWGLMGVVERRGWGRMG